MIQRQLKIEKNQEKEKEYVEVFEQNEVVRISNFIRINKEKMQASSLNLRLQRKQWKKIWRSRQSNYAEKRLLQSKNHFK